MWDVSVAHSADHYSFMRQISSPILDLGIPGIPNVSAAFKFLRIRVKRPESPDGGGGYTYVGQVCSEDDLYRLELAQEIFFKPVAMKPNLDQTYYATTGLLVLLAQKEFHRNLVIVDTDVRKMNPNFIPLVAGTQKDNPDPPYEDTISASIQY
jgi:hypothetical protein